MRRRTVLLTFLSAAALVATGALSPAQASAPAGGRPVAAAAAVPVEKVGFQPVGPARLLDTRSGSPIAARTERLVQVTGTAGVPAAGVGAVALNVTATEPSTTGWLTVYPAEGAPPATSTVNFTRGVTVAGNVVVGTSAGTPGQVAVRNSTGTTHAIVDITGWFPTGRGVTAVAPERYLDTRTSTPLGARQTREVTIGGVGAIPGDALAVSLTVTATAPTSDGYLILWPSGQPRPNTSVVNFGSGQTIANSTIATLGTGGRVSLYNASGSTHALIDVTGYLDAASGYVPLLNPVRIADTRQLSYQQWDEYPIQQEQVQDYFYPGIPRFSITSPQRGSSPAMPFGAGSAVLNLTVTRPSAPGWLTAWPSTGATRPKASTVNFRSGQTIANGALMGVGWGRGLQAAANAGNMLDLIIDVNGFFPADGVGLLSEPWQTRQYSQGRDRLGVLICEPNDGQTRPALDQVALISALTTGVGDFYRWFSRGTYDPTYEMASTTAFRPATRDGCLAEASTRPLNSTGYEGLLVVDGSWRSGGAAGLAGSGYTPESGFTTYPANARDGIVSATSVLGFDATPPFLAVAAHEQGHMLSLLHTFRYGGTDPYANPMDLMSGGGGQTAVGSTAVARFRLGWIAPSEVATHRGGTASYTLAPLTATGTQLLVIPASVWGSAVTIGVRTSQSHDAALPKHGVEVMYTDELGASGAEPRDAPVSTEADEAAHVLTVGQTLSLGPVTLTVAAVDAEGRYTVTVTGMKAIVPNLQDQPMLGPVRPAPGRPWTTTPLEVFGR